MSIPDIFETHGEAHFRDGEARVIARLLDHGPIVLATGGGAFMREETRDRIRAKAISIWLKADADVIMRRVRRRADRPLLQTADPEATVNRLLGEREPVYQNADMTILSRDVPHDTHRRGMHRGAARPALRRRHGRASNRRDQRHAMTAPLKHSDPITVDVALGDRAYDIVIGRDCCRRWGRASPRSVRARAPPLSPTAPLPTIGSSRPRHRSRRPALPARGSLSRKARARRATPG